jgi:hypothetical protein
MLGVKSCACREALSIPDVLAFAECCSHRGGARKRGVAALDHHAPLDPDDPD